MKDLRVLEASEVGSYLHGLWRTSLFRESTYVAGWVERFAQHPAAFAEMSDVELETPHFATYFGLTYHRTYDEDAISDLYYLHEIVHAALLTYEPDLLFTAWYRRMASIEFSASLETEGNVYVHLPELRERSFADEIWADRFLGGQRRLGPGILDIIRQERYRAMQSPDPMDYCEQQIAAYARQNFEWATMWRLPMSDQRPAYLHVEAHMSRLRAGEVSADAHGTWLGQSGDIPFPDQARLFAPVYWNNKLSYRLRKL